MSTTATTIDNFIAGAAAPPSAGRCEDIRDPAAGELIARAPLSDGADVDAAVDAAGGRVRRLVAVHAGRARARAAAHRRRDRGSRGGAARPFSARP